MQLLAGDFYLFSPNKYKILDIQINTQQIVSMQFVHNDEYIKITLTTKILIESAKGQITTDVIYVKTVSAKILNMITHHYVNLVQ